MTIGKQLFLYIVFLGVYSSSSMCMDKQELTNQEQVEQAPTGQKLDFDLFPLNVQEQIISYLPADNLYRALWSRYHNASQLFCDDTTKAYLESHFVPQDFIDKIIAKDFAHFHGSEKQKQEFQEKIKRALERYGQSNTELFARYRQCVNDRIVEITNTSFDGQVLEQLMNLINSSEDECTRIVGQLKETGELAQVRKQLQKYRSCIECYRAWLPLTQNKAMSLRALNRALDNKTIRMLVPMVLLQLVCYAIGSTVRPIVDEQVLRQLVGYAIGSLDDLGVKLVDEQTELINIQWLPTIIYICISIPLVIKIKNLLENCSDSAFNKLDHSFANHLLYCVTQLEKLQAKISRVLITIEQLEKA